MKAIVTAAGILIAVLLPCIAPAQDDRLAKLQDGFSRHTTTLDEKLASDLEKLSSGYAGALKKLQATVQQAGKLEEAVIVRNEIEAVEAGKHPLPELVAGTPFALKQLRGKFTTARRKIEVEHATALTDSAAKMEAALEELEVASTKAGKLDQALAAKRAREALETRAEIKNASDLLKVSGRILSRPALRLRRGGDNLEVLVHYDSRGKVSMKSPVENVREETGGSKERGDTKAKVLGEFVGAKGFEVDSHVSYHHVFDSKDPGGLVLTAIESKFRHQQGDRKGMRLSLEPGGVNPHGNFGDLLPGLAAPGTYSITCRYFIPKSNRIVGGFQFVQGVGSPIGGKIFDTSGKWTEETVTAESPNASGTLLFYLTAAEGKKLSESLDDFVVLGELKVEQLKFSAFVRTKFDEDGDEVEADDPSKQARYISNGEFAAE